MAVKVKEELSHICQIIAETVDAEKIYLFGSYAYRQPRVGIVTMICVFSSLIWHWRPADAVKRIRRALFMVPGHAAGCDRVSYRSLSAEASTALPGTKNCERGGGPV